MQEAELGAEWGLGHRSGPVCSLSWSRQTMGKESARGLCSPSSPGQRQFRACCGSTGVPAVALLSPPPPAKPAPGAPETWNWARFPQTEMPRSEEDEVVQHHRAVQGGSELPTFSARSCGAAQCARPLTWGKWDLAGFSCGRVWGGAQQPGEAGGFKCYYLF